MLLDVKIRSESAIAEKMKEDKDFKISLAEKERKHEKYEEKKHTESETRAKQRSLDSTDSTAKIDFVRKLRDANNLSISHVPVFNCELN